MTRSRIALFVAGITIVCALTWLHWPGPGLTEGITADRVRVEKSLRRLTLLRGNVTLASYSVALGRNPVGPKTREGDGRTPEGVYVIDYRKLDSSFHRALHINYPSPADVENARAARVSPGGLIMIHGLANGLGWMGRAHRARDWTDGCIAVTNQEIEEILAAVPDGTPIEILP